MSPIYTNYQLGQEVRITANFINVYGVDTDPDAVYFSYINPDGDSVTHEYGDGDEVVKSGDGVYYFDLPLDKVGTWHYRVYSTGEGAASFETNIIVQPSNFA